MKRIEIGSVDYEIMIKYIAKCAQLIGVLCGLDRIRKTAHYVGASSHF